MLEKEDIDYEKVATHGVMNKDQNEEKRNRISGLN